MALTSTIYTFTIDLSDVDRGVYESLELRVAMHPSESAEYLVARVLAYCLEYREGIAFAAGGVSDAEEPAVLVRDLTGRIVTWIEIGSPDADRLHRASKLAERVAVYSHRDLRTLLPQLRERKIHRASEIPIYTFGKGFIDALVAKLERRTRWSLSVTEQHLYLNDLETILEEQRVQRD
ncbi:MAG TPA: YaeQ family protein [Thermoanaerobaculia bacterium]|nr:YaeQ family protein [Thermoanaerobaculia bacterium]